MHTKYANKQTGKKIRINVSMGQCSASTHAESDIEHERHKAIFSTKCMILYNLEIKTSYNTFSLAHNIISLRSVCPESHSLEHSKYGW